MNPVPEQKNIETNFTETTGSAPSAPSIGMSTSSIPAANTPAIPDPASNIIAVGSDSVVQRGEVRSQNFSSGNAGWRITSNGDVEFNDGVFRGTITATGGTIGGFTITSTALYGGIIKTGATVQAGSTGVIMDTTGLRGYDSVLGLTFNLPTDGSAPTFSSGTITETTFNISTNAVLRTSATVGDGSASSTGVLINNTGIYGCGANQLLADANIRILNTGTMFAGSATNYIYWDGTYLKLKGSFDVGTGGLINNATYTVATMPITPTSAGYNSAAGTDTTTTVKALVVGGGGGGATGSGGGGGGAGGYQYNAAFAIAVGAYSIVVGAGGAADTVGNASTFSTITGNGGGAGGGGNGGSGGGATGGGSVGTGNQGSNGGNGTTNGNHAGGGGGGSSAVGGNSTASFPNTGGAGGAGTANSISGTSVTYAGGGGGGGESGGAGGAGGGGVGMTDSGGSPSSSAGTANTGGGGGGGALFNPTARAGGSGIVIISYLTGSMTATGGTITTSGGYTIHTFTSNGTFTVVSMVLNPANAYSSNNVYATMDAVSGVLDVSISKDAGVTYTSVLQKTYTGAEGYQSYGNASTELWGTAITGDDIDDTSFRVKLTHNGLSIIYKTFGFAITPSYILTGLDVSIEGKYASSTISIDHVRVKAYYGTSILPVQAGSQAFATDGRKNGEGAGSGTGVLCFYDGTAWRACDTGASVAA